MQRTATVNLVLRVVSEIYGVPEDVLLTYAGRKRTLLEPRAVAIALIWRHTKATQQGLAELFHRRDHTTIINALENAEVYFQTEHAAQACEARVSGVLAAGRPLLRPGHAAALTRVQRRSA